MTPKQKQSWEFELRGSTKRKGIWIHWKTIIKTWAAIYDIIFDLLFFTESVALWQCFYGSL